MNKHGDNLWHQTAQETVETTPFSGGITCDLAIIGGGFTGCSAALEAARSGASVALLEARKIGHGGSGRNVGLANAGLWLPPNDVLKAAGQEDGARLLQRLLRAPDDVFDIIARENINCEATRAGTLHLAHAPSGMRDLENRHRQLSEIGSKAELLSQDEAARRTGSQEFYGAIWDPKAGTVQPYSYCKGLARAAQSAGAQIYENAPVTSVQRSGAFWEITSNGKQVKARSILLATNAYHSGAAGVAAPAYVPVHFCQYATAPLSGNLRAHILAGGEGCWDTALVMTSFRLDRDGRLILGALGDGGGPGGAIHAAWARRKLTKLFPALADIPFECGWSGRIAMSSNYIPKLVSLGPNALSVYGYSGRGIAPGTAFGIEAARALLTQNFDELPLPVMPAHSQRFSTLKQAYFELGATLAHATQAR